MTHTPYLTTLSPAADSDVLRRAFSCFPSGVVAVCARIGDELVGMAASAFTTVSLEPPLVSLCVQNTSTTWPRLRGVSEVGVSVFAGDQSALCRQLAGPAHLRFAAIEPLHTEAGAVFVPGAAASLSCSLYNEIPAGDHTLVLLRINQLDADPAVEPLVFHASGFRTLVSRAAVDAPSGP
ncbi:flavin reductase [Gordonia pseudamarae]|jgi:flavin reductase (DIM6/NTAB) family NADH-FMN oxidoreductase RutF|uniref:Flavin reductase n=1 Tax=Gordonia pseudamarae TaxID=2831662 RepID=A0ABX6IGW2_9ACTN|nr:MULTISPECIES: flavin reductase family protein [Gordonia]MBD0023627.1 flavin reductase family protein [Gordonia sp. (in: high G+C Gram-positive bacteria)]QHN25444.1 flavin reductase [Gordonia pseudamarae]QHN34376.1 flavin reductase [Gordonia pseudamarae]